MITRLEAFSHELESLATLEKREGMEAYMKGKFSFLGVMSTPRRELQKIHFKEWKKDKSLDTTALAKRLWDLPFREFQYAAMDWTKASSLWKNHQSIEQFEAWICDKSWWDTVDFLASTCVGAYFLQFPKERDTWVEKWNASTNMWLNRTALLFQLKYGTKTDSDLLFAIIDTHKSQKDFFIRKAIGWALRELSKKQPALVADFLNRTELAPLSRKEASKYLDGVPTL